MFLLAGWNDDLSQLFVVDVVHCVCFPPSERLPGLSSESLEKRLARVPWEILYYFRECYEVFF